VQTKLLLGGVALFVLGGVLLTAAGQPPAAQPEAVAVPKAKPSIARVGASAGAAAVTVDTAEVSVAAYRKCVEAKACAERHIATDTPSPCNYMEPGRDDHPMNCVDWAGAAEYCAFAGGRLCTGDEWLHACRGTADLDYPYGPEYQSGSCRAASMNDPARPMTTAPVGSSPACESAEGISDMAGNVSEWVDECKGDYCKFYGGAFLTNEPLSDFASCKRFCAGNQKTFRSATIGVRCCYDGAPPR